MTGTGSDVKAVQAAALASANAKIAPAMELYAERNKIQFQIYRLPMRDLIRLNQLLARLTEDDLRQVTAFAEGLAAWNDDAPQAPATK